MFLEKFYKQKDLIFIHIPKTAGCSIEHILIKEYEKNNKAFFQEAPSFQQKIKKVMVKNKQWGQHFSLREIQELYKIQDINKCIKFCVVRNPWDRAVSEFLYLNKMKGCACKSLKEIPRSFQKYVTSDFKCSWKNHISPQVDFIKNKEGKIFMDSIIKFEKLEEQVLKTFDILGINHVDALPKINLSINSKMRKVNPYWAFYNKETKKIIEKKYEEDIDFFEYVFRPKLF